MLCADKVGLALSTEAARGRSAPSIIPTAAAAGNTGSYAALGASHISHTEAYVQSFL